MRSAWNPPDHVTRYTHRDDSRWLVQPGRVRSMDAWDVAGYVGVVLAVPAIAWALAIVLGVI